MCSGRYGHTQWRRNVGNAQLIEINTTKVKDGKGELSVQCTALPDLSSFSFSEDGFGQTYSSGSQCIFPLLFYLSCLPSPILAYLKGSSFLLCFFISLIFSQKQITFSFGAEDWTPALRLSTPSVTKLYPSQGTWQVHITYLTHNRSSRNYLSIMSIASKK